MKKILIVDDEPDIRRTLKAALEADGYAVREAGDAVGARTALQESIPDLILLDIKMPGEDGLAFCKRLREEPGKKGIPVIFLTSRGQESQKILGLEFGADDYVVKPFSAGELLARIKAVIRRRSGDLDEDVLTDGNVVLDGAAQSVKQAGRVVELTAKEFQVLRLLMRKKGRVISRPYLMESIWGRDYEQTTRTVDQHIYKIRKALGSDGKRIVSVGTAGYKWEDE
jgi:DNA-binding response OmpR family regulator